MANSLETSLAGLKRLTCLTKLELLNLARMRDFSVLSKMQTLRWLAICGSKHVSNINFIHTLENLKVLRLEDVGQLDSLAPLGGSKELVALSLVGSTNVKDGDLCAIAMLPKLSMCAYVSRRHYSHKIVKAWSWLDYGKPDQLVVRK